MILFNVCACVCVSELPHPICLWICVEGNTSLPSRHINIKTMSFEPVCEKINNLGFLPGPTQTVLHKHRRWQEAGNFGFRKKRNCTIRVAKTKGLITAKLICAFIFAYANCWFSHAKAHLMLIYAVIAKVIPYSFYLTHSPVSIHPGLAEAHTVRLAFCYEI